MNGQLKESQEKLSRVEQSVEALADTLQGKMGENEREDELAKSLRDIEVAYKKNILQLGKDLNRMEFKVT